MGWPVYFKPHPIGNICKYCKKCLAVFSGQVLSFLRFCVVFLFFRSRSLQNRPGTCLNASGMSFASNLHMEMGKTIHKSIRSEQLGI